MAGKTSQINSTYGPHYTGKGLQKPFSSRVAYIDDRHVLIPHMLKCRKRYMASLILDDL